MAAEGENAPVVARVVAREDDAHDPPVDPTTPDFATRVAMEEELWTSRLDAIDEEEVDDRRSQAMQSSIKSGYANLIAHNNGEVRDLVCKTNRCKMEIEWATKSDMKDGSKSALHAYTRMSEGCARHVRRDEEEMRSVVIFECDENFVLE